MSERPSIENIEQELVEMIAGFLDSDSVQMEQAMGGFEDPVDRQKSELHLRMAKAAMKEYKRTVIGNQ